MIEPLSFKGRAFVIDIFGLVLMIMMLQYQYK